MSTSNETLAKETAGSGAESAALATTTRPVPTHRPHYTSRYDE